MWGSRWAGAVLASALASGVTGSANAAEVGLERATRRASPGQQVTAIVNVAGARKCRLYAGKARRAVAVGNGTRVRFRFAVARAARPGRHTIRVICAEAEAAYGLTVARTARAGTGRLVAGQISALVTGRPSPHRDHREERRGEPPSDDPPWPVTPALPPPTTSPYAPEVTEIWVKEVKPLFEAKTGECTQWVYEKRPDVAERSERYGIARWLDGRAPGHRYSLVLALASAWADGARSAGLEVDRSPAVGAIMVEPGNPGHVAHVEAVGAGWFEVSEMNAPESAVVTRRSIDTAAIGPERLQFIH